MSFKGRSLGFELDALEAKAEPVLEVPAHATRCGECGAWHRALGCPMCALERQAALSREISREMGKRVPQRPQRPVRATPSG